MRGRRSGFGSALAQHLARDRRGVSFAECQELQQIRHGIAFRPPEVRVGILPV